MKFTSVQYYNNKLNTVEGIKLTIDNEILFVPLDPANRHYAEIMRQVVEGTLTIQEATQE